MPYFFSLLLWFITDQKVWTHYFTVGQKSKNKKYSIMFSFIINNIYYKGIYYSK